MEIDLTLDGQDLTVKYDFIEGYEASFYDPGDSDDVDIYQIETTKGNTIIDLKKCKKEFLEEIEELCIKREQDYLAS